MFREPRRPEDPNGDDNNERLLNILNWTAYISSGLVAIIAFAAGGQMLSDPEAFNAYVDATQHISTSLGASVEFFRNIGLTDRQIAISMLGLSGVSFGSTYMFHRTINR